MVVKYELIISSATIDKTVKYLTNQIYKLLPYKEENDNWEKALYTVIEELVGLSNLLVDIHEQSYLLSIICKLEGLFKLDDNFELYRKVIFESINLLGRFKKQCQDYIT